MAKTPRRQADRDLLAFCQEERERALNTLRLITHEGWTFHQRPGEGPINDVTAERAAREKQIIRLMDRLIARAEGRPDP